MKSFREYLLEDGKQYTYRIKIAGELTTEQVDAIKRNLEGYDVVSFSNPKKTPIQASPAGFPGLENVEINIINFTFKYPASLDEIQQRVHLAGIPTQNIVVLNAVWDDSNSEELDKIAQQSDVSEKSALLNTEDLGRPTAQQLALSKDHAGGNQAMAKASASKESFTVAGGKTAKAKTTNELPQQQVSPFTNVNKAAKVRIGGAAINVGK